MVPNKFCINKWKCMLEYLFLLYILSQFSCAILNCVYSVNHKKRDTYMCYVWASDFCLLLWFSCKNSDLLVHVRTVILKAKRLMKLFKKCLYTLLNMKCPYIRTRINIVHAIIKVCSSLLITSQRDLNDRAVLFNSTQLHYSLSSQI